MPTPSLIEVHEDRLSRLEEDVTECRVGLAVVKMQITDGVAMLSKKMDDVKALSARVEELESDVKVRRRLVKIATVVAAGIGSVVGFILKLVFGG